MDDMQSAARSGVQHSRSGSPHRNQDGRHYLRRKCIMNHIPSGLTKEQLQEMLELIGTDISEKPTRSCGKRPQINGDIQPLTCCDRQQHQPQKGEIFIQLPVNRAERVDNVAPNFSVAFVTFPDESEAQRFIEIYNGIYIEAKLIKVSLCRSSISDIKHTQIALQGLPKEWKSADFENAFKPYGEVISARIDYSNESMGYLTMGTIRERDAVLNDLKNPISMLRQSSTLRLRGGRGKDLTFF